MNKEAIIKYLSLAAKAASLLVGAAAYSDLIPAKYAPLAVIIFGLASVAKDTINRIGDFLDDGVSNGSFKG